MLDLNEIKELVEALHEAEEEVSQAIDEAAQAWAEVKRLRAEIKRLRAPVPPASLLRCLADYECAGRHTVAQQALALARRIEEAQE